MEIITLLQKFSLPAIPRLLILNWREAGGWGDRGAMILVPYESGIPRRVITDLLTYHGIESWGFDISFEEMIFFVRPNDHQEAISLLVQSGITYHQEMLNVNRSLVLGIVGGTIFLLGALIIGLSLSLALLG